MTRRGYSNVAYPMYLVGTLDGSSTTNTISVSAEVNGTPGVPGGWPGIKPYFAVIDPDTPSEEVVFITGAAAETLTITRGTALGASGFGTTTKPHSSGAKIVHVATAADYDEMNAHTNGITGVHGLASGSAVVGTTDTQTLLNKTFGSGSVTSAVTVASGGVVVGTSASQTLTNKTLTSPTLSGTPTGYVDPTSAQTLTNKILVQAHTQGPVFDVRAYGAVGDGAADDTTAVQAAFNAATNVGGTVLIPAGTYRMTSTLRWKRNTTVICDPGATLLRGANTTFLANGVSGQNLPGYTGEGNLRWVGGTIDNQALTFTSPNNCFSLGHAENISIEGVTFKDVATYHAIELDAVKRASVRDCRFLGWADSTGLNNSFRECIQIDLPKQLVDGTSTFGAFGPYDSTPSRDITISQCYFGPSGTPGTLAPRRAVGGHSATAGVHYDNIRIINNYCDSLGDWAISAYATSGLQILGNTITGCGAGIRLASIDPTDPNDNLDVNGVATNASQAEIGVTIANNVIRNTAASIGDVIRLYGQTTGLLLTVSVTGNTIDTAGTSARGINCRYTQRLTITGNSIYNTNGSSIYVDNCSDTTISGNNCNVTGGTGIYTANSDGVAISGNQVRSTGGDGISLTAINQAAVSGNQLRLINDNGIYLTSGTANFVVSGNNVRGASRGTAGLTFGIRLSASVTRGNITGNRVGRWGSGNEYLNAFSATNTCTIIKRYGNSFQDGTAGAGTAIADGSTTPDTTATDQTLA